MTFHPEINQLLWYVLCLVGVELWLGYKIALGERREEWDHVRGLPYMTSALRAGGGPGVPSNANIVSNLSKGGCVNLRTGVIKNLQILRTSYMEALLD